MAVFRLTRRRLLVGAAGGLVVAGATGLWLGVNTLADRRYRRPVVRDVAFAPNVYLAIEPDGSVVIWVTRSEMGQGVATALPMLVAEELDADWSRVRVEQAAAQGRYDYGRLFTAASSSVPSLWTELRRAGAVARSMLIDAAARRWGVAPANCETRAGTVRHGPHGRVLGYGELANEAALSRVPLRVELKPRWAFTLIGKPVPRLDTAGKVTGQARYGLDVRVPGMRHAVLARAPTAGARLVSLDDSAARQVAGVERVIRLDDTVAVVASGSYAALRGRAALAIEWAAGPDEPVSDALIDAALVAALGGDSFGVAVDRGDLEAQALGAAHTLVAEYRTDYVAHACMEPMNCTARVGNGSCEIWVPTQDPEGARSAAAALTGLDPVQITVHVTQLGGGFGRRASQDFVVEAVRLARELDGPVQLLWSREDDFRHGEHRPASQHRLEAALDDAGMPIGWRHRVVTTQAGQSQPSAVDLGDTLGAGDLPYAGIAAVRAEWAAARVPVPTRIWRSVGHSFNTFATEAFVDEIAGLRGADPLEFRARLLVDSPRLAACLARVREASGWAQALADGRFLGVACGRCMGAFAAVVVRLAVDGDPRLVDSIWCAVDCGIVVNPDIAAAQLEGGLLFGYSAAIGERLSFQDGRVRETNFDGYRLARLPDTPAVHVMLIDSAEYPSGLGEAGVPLVAPALANALFRRDGTRRRTLPLHERSD
ncbi:MAG: xanthine dehydrogenase family protein molybdopterin-binding subunit [Pseudomonadales bacterium]|nr:xanthine dehydrogenase family protein molybdopterin-binding subunit [Pseudomonadales bacterium]